MNDFDSILKTAVGEYKPSKAVFDRVKKNIKPHKSSVTVVFFSDDFGKILNEIYRKNTKKHFKYLVTLVKNKCITLS